MQAYELIGQVLAALSQTLQQLQETRTLEALLKDAPPGLS